MAAITSAKQMRLLLQSISSDPQMKQSKDSILLAEDQYPDSLDAIFTKLTLQNTMTLLQWQRNACDSSYDAALKNTSITNQDYVRKTYQLVPTADNPWDANTFRQWKYFVTNLCLSAVQDAMKATDYGKSMKYLFQPDVTEDTKKAQHNTKSNVQGLLLYHPILLDSPWQAPDDIDTQVGLLLSTTEPILMARAEKEDDLSARDRDNAQKQLAVLHLSIKSILERVYRITSHSFHVLLMDLIPHARIDRSPLFTHIKGARTDHIIALRAHHAKKRDVGLPDLTDEELKPHSAQHTLRFIEEEYVEKDDDASHYTWGEILTATRLPKISLFTWVDSFTLLTLRYGETIDRVSKGRQLKINKVIVKQITDDEKQIIATLNPAFTALKLQDGDYVVTDLIKLLAQNATSFTQRYAPQDHMRIMKYLRTRTIRQVVTPSFIEATTKGKGKGKRGLTKRQKVQTPTQRAWTYAIEPAIGLTPPSPYQPKGKGYFPKGKGKSSDGKGKGKLPSKGKGKGKQKGDKGKRSPKGKPTNKGKGTSAPGLLPITSSGDLNHGHLKCHFCHTLGHIKPNCRKWLALQTSDTYKQRNSHETKYQLIYDHLEDSILAPRLCQYCSDSECDGFNCESPFDPDDYNEASMFFTQTLSSLVMNAKLERPLDSHAPQTDQLYMYEDDTWGETQEDEDYNHWETQDNYESGENYAIEDETEDYPEEEEPLSQDSEDFDEDDQDNYS